MYSSETESRLAQLQAIAQQRDLTSEEEKEAIKLIREDRVSAAYASKASKEKKTPADGNAVLAKLKEQMGLK